MKRKRIFFLAAVVCIAFLAGCGARRVAPFAPRMPDIRDHKGLASDETCLDCHDIKSLPSHKESDTCFDCHTIIPGR